MVKESLPLVKSSRTGQTFELLWRVRGEEWMGGGVGRGGVETRHEVVGQTGRGDGQEGGVGEVQSRKSEVGTLLKLRGCILKFVVVLRIEEVK